MATLAATAPAAGRMRLGMAGLAASPSLQQPQSVSSLDALPRDILLRIVSLLSYEEASAIRTTSRNIARAAEEMMARAFDNYGALLLRRIRDLRLAPDFSFYTCLVCKTLYQIEIEYRLLRAAVGVYVREGAAPFVGGRLLDLLWEALRLSAAPPPPRDSAHPSSTSTSSSHSRSPIAFADLFTPDIVDELSTLVEQYIAFYEKEVEPRLRTPTPLSVKVVDVLDAFVGGSSDAEMRTHGGWRSLRARYHLPLTGLMFHDEDPEPTARLVVPENEARSLLAALREAARKSGQRYVSALLQRELASAEARRNSAQSGLFSSRRRCVARDRLLVAHPTCSSTSCCGGNSGNSAGGACTVLRERLERRPLRDPPPPERDRHSLVLRVAVRLRFLLNQRPLEADCLGVPLDESADVCLNDPGAWGWATGGEEEAPPPDGGPPPHEDPRAAFWFQLEVHRLPPGKTSTVPGSAPTRTAAAETRGVASSRLLYALRT